MDISQIGNFLSTNVFSVAMCILLFWKMDKQDKEHKEETEKLAEALENNTLAIQHLSDMLNK